MAKLVESPERWVDQFLRASQDRDAHLLIAEKHRRRMGHAVRYLQERCGLDRDEVAMLLHVTADEVRLLSLLVDG